MSNRSFTSNSNKISHYLPNSLGELETVGEVSFEFSTLLINDKFLIKIFDRITDGLQNLSNPLILHAKSTLC